MPAPIPDEIWHQFDVLHGQRGYSISRAAKAVGISRTSAQGHVKGQKQNGDYYAKRAIDDEIPNPVDYDDLNENAKRAVEDFAFFRSYYLGRETVPWQEQGARKLLAAEQSEDDEYIVMNQPPGAGKSTTWTHDYPLWRIIGNRRIRIQIGSRTQRQAKDYTSAIRRTLERPYVVDGAQGCIVRDFGRFKTDNTEKWAADDFVVAQLGGKLIEEKEATVRAISQDGAFLGFRADLIIWDDLVDKQNTTDPEMRGKLEDFWVTYAETRLEPGGLLVLQGQRIAPEDLYHFALDMRTAGYEDVEWDELDEEDAAELPRKYHHIVFPAHDDEGCVGDHGEVYEDEDGRKRRRPPTAWPEGCLLDPVRLPWRKLSGLRYNNRRLYEVSYQQKDAAAGQFLVAEDWLTGGEDKETGEHFVGCYDRGWDGSTNPATTGKLISVMAADPAPSGFWSVQWWNVDVDHEQYYLRNLLRKRMGANDFLDRDQAGNYRGVAEEWVQAAKDVGRPITHLIVEQNAAQKFLTQYQFFQDWLRSRRITLVPHQTQGNKTDPQWGVQPMGSLFRLGKVTLPWSAPWGRKVSQPLVDEALRWPEGSTSDCVMAMWFVYWNIRKLRFAFKPRIKRKVPSWLPGTKAAA